ncbi:hypothetical protein SUDANB15_02612 [Streptomyces sp. enrichment culture]|uniref:hypothetical protein n=1 Tax=Streptomyces sp. enrichment culture TaxID=1795815 RepID=UPI003F55B24D
MTPEFRPGDLWYTLTDTAHWLGRKRENFRTQMAKQRDAWRFAPYSTKDARGRWLFNVSAIHRDWAKLYPNQTEQESTGQEAA